MHDPRSVLVIHARRVCCFLALIVAGLFVGCGSPIRPRSSGDQILAIVGNRTIRERDLERRILERYYGKRSLLGLVREALFELEAERLGVVISAQEVEDAVRGELAAASAELDRRLAQVGLDREDVASELRQEIRNALLLERVVRPQRQIGEREIQGVYERTFAVDRAWVRHIAFPFSVVGRPTDQRVAEVRHDAEKAWLRIRAGKDFSVIAREISGNRQTAARGGEMGVISATTPMDPTLRELILSLPEAEPSEPVRESDYGFHIFVVDRRIPARPLADVREEIRRQLLESPASDAEISAVEQLLRSRTSVTVFGDDRWDSARN